MLASDMTDMTFFPIGTIFMMDGSWTDGRGGWYICDGRNTPYGKTPDLRDKFVKGSTISGATGGGQVTLSINNLPPHSHTVSLRGSGVSHTSTNAPALDTGGAHAFIIPTSTEGNGKPFDVIPSYYSMIYIKKMV